MATSQYTEFFLGANSKVAQIETLELSHPNLSKTYWIVRNIKQGWEATLEDGMTIQQFDYYPVRIEQKSLRQNLDQGYSITFGDIGKTLTTELERIRQAGGFDIYPVLKYRTWRSDYPDVPLFGPQSVEIVSVTAIRTGCSFDAKAPSLNGNQTGILYRIDEIPMLRGCL